MFLRLINPRDRPMLKTVNKYSMHENKATNNTSRPRKYMAPQPSYYLKLTLFYDDSYKITTTHSDCLD